MNAFLFSRILAILAGLLLSVTGFGQSYFTAGGLRLGTDWGLTIQQRVAKKTTVEFILQSSLFREEAMMTLLAEQHTPLISRRFNLYVGGGLHKGWNTATPLYGTVDQPKYRDPFGITFIGGAEVSIGKLNASYDFKPVINISGGERFFYSQSGVSLRYIIAKKPFWEESKKSKKRKKRKNSNFRYR